MPKFRTTTYAFWRASERMGIRPPEIPASWDEMTSYQQAMVLAYSQIREQEDAEMGGMRLF